MHGSAGVLLNEQLTGAHPRPWRHCRPHGAGAGASTMALEHGDATPAIPGALVFVHGGAAAAAGASRGQSEELLEGHRCDDGGRCGADGSKTLKSAERRCG